MGAGPYKLVAFNPGIELVLEAFEGYWRKPPAIKRLVLRTITDETTRAAAVKRGEVDLIYLVSGPVAEELKRTPGFKVASPLPSVGQFWLDFPEQGNSMSPWHDQRVRLAASLAVDRKAVSEAEWLGFARPSGNIVLKALEFALELPPHPYDPTRAKALLAEAGYAGGFDGGDFTPFPPYNSMGEAIANYLRAVGIRTRIKTMERAAFLTAWREKKIPGVIMALVAPSGNAATRLEPFVTPEGFRPNPSTPPGGNAAMGGVGAAPVRAGRPAPPRGFGPLERGKPPPAVHFAQINEMDGFFLTGRAADPAFTWQKLAGKKVLVDHGGQPLAMFKYACHRRSLDYKALQAVNVPSGQMDETFRKGQGDYIHQQGPEPQQLEHDKVGHVVASVGEAIGPCAFSSLAATRQWLGTDAATRFTRAYRKARAWLLATPAARVAEAEAAFFPQIDRAVLTATIAYYQKLGCWTPHGEITPPAFQAALDVCQHPGLITRRTPYQSRAARPPA